MESTIIIPLKEYEEAEAGTSFFFTFLENGYETKERIFTKLQDNFILVNASTKIKKTETDIVIAFTNCEIVMEYCGKEKDLSAPQKRSVRGKQKIALSDITSEFTELSNDWREFE